MKNLFIPIISCLLLAACGNSTKESSDSEDTYVALEQMNIDNLLKEIEKREKVLKEEKGATNGEGAIALMDAYAVYAEKFSNRANSAEMLFKAGEIAMGLNQTAKSIKYLSKVYSDYPTYEKRPYALFLKAFVLENQAQNFEEAKKAYEEFIFEFPTHEMKDDAEYSILNMGKSPEELIREFEIQDSLNNLKKAS